jgi:hypothetical protein
VSRDDTYNIDLTARTIPVRCLSLVGVARWITCERSTVVSSHTLSSHPMEHTTSTSVHLRRGEDGLQTEHRTETSVLRLPFSC